MDDTHSGSQTLSSTKGLISSINDANNLINNTTPTTTSISQSLPVTAHVIPRELLPQAFQVITQEDCLFLCSKLVHSCGYCFIPCFDSSVLRLKYDWKIRPNIISCRKQKTRRTICFHRHSKISIYKPIRAVPRCSNNNNNSCK
jgi:hypothetical protein